VSLHEKMMQSHGAGNGNPKGMPKDITSFEITFKGKKKIAEGTYEFIFNKPADLTYKAGQHGRMTLMSPPETDDEGNARFLSFASTPDEPDVIFAMRMSNSAFKQVLEQMRPGGKVLWQMRKSTPHGSFALQDAADAAKPAVFLIGGIGIVPVFSIIKDALVHGVQHKVTLFYSNRRPEDAPYLADLQKLAKENPAVFELVATMTEPEKSAQTWKGETGFISQTMIEKHIKNLQAPIYYIAGLTAMVAAMQKLLADTGVTKDNIRAEEFGAFSMAHAAKSKPRSWKQYMLNVALGLLVVAAVAVHFIGISVSPVLLNLLAALIVVKIIVFVVLKRKRQLAHHNPHVQYACPMHPEVKQDTPGTCPKCGMTLVSAQKG
jgi:ferredoxin-NADP reductase